ncbi:DUF397 domain-containing protein [Streptomyces erythrochromogenes]|uniref:DUF397 domain-containing protein n=1 Tax=Streptomyces erythrochromogenes TaxID=285574 RepID=UPI0036B22A43
MTDTGLNWYKSSYSGNTNDACIEVAEVPAAAKVRDSKLSQSPILTFGHSQWSTFIGFAKEQSV